MLLASLQIALDQLATKQILHNFNIILEVYDEKVCCVFQYRFENIFNFSVTHRLESK